MAAAKKCDICGKLYEEYNFKQSKYNFNGFMLLNIDYGPTCDCCPKCIKSIRGHINSLMKKEE